MKIDPHLTRTLGAPSDPEHSAQADRRLQSWTAALERELLAQRTPMGAPGDERPKDAAMRDPWVRTAASAMPAAVPAHGTPHAMTQVSPVAAPARPEVTPPAPEPSLSFGMSAAFLNPAVPWHGAAAVTGAAATGLASTVAVVGRNGAATAASVQASHAASVEPPRPHPPAVHQAPVVAAGTPPEPAEPLAEPKAPRTAEHTSMADLQQPDLQALHVTRTPEGLQAWVRDALRPAPTPRQLRAALEQLDTAFGGEVTSLHWNAKPQWSRSGAAPHVSDITPSTKENRHGD